jgi:mannose-1-phosphate guanylyltransferase
VVLAGGEGSRLRPLTRLIAGDDRPKQFCRFFGGHSLLQQTLARVGLNVPVESTLCVVMREHRRYYEPELRALEPWQIVEQPSNRGTAAAVASALRRIAAVEQAPGVVGFFPSDHHYSNVAALRRTVSKAYGAAAEHRDRLFLVGATATGPEVDYGWIEPGQPIGQGDGGNGALTISRFWEKPAPGMARGLFERGCLWNTFILVGCTAAFGRALRRSQPGFWSRFEALEPGAGWGGNAGMAALYEAIEPLDFSRDVLERSVEDLAVVPLPDAGWTDLGRPARALNVMRCEPRLRIAVPEAARQA